MPTLKAYIAEMVNRQQDADGFGRIETATALTTQSVSVSALAVGGLSSSKYQNKYIWRPDSTSTADRQRLCTNFAPATGTFTQQGAAYSDTTVGTEQVGILEYEPVGKMAPAVNLALSRLRRRDVTIIPTNGANRYWLGQLSWINEPGDVQAVYYAPRPILSRNRYFQTWPVASSDTAAATSLPEWFTLSGAAATAQRITTNTYVSGQYGVQVVAGGAAVASMMQTVGLVNDGVSSANLQGKQITVAIIGRATAASTLRAWYSDDGGTTKQYTSYHTGNSAQQELYLTVNVSTTATNPSFGFDVAISGTAQVSQCYLAYGPMSDGVRLDNYRAIEMNKVWDQSGALMLVVDAGYGVGGQIEVHSKRAYPTLTNDTDTADAPLTTVAVNALRLLYRGLASTAGQDNTRYKELEARWRVLAATLQAKHYSDNFPTVGLDFLPRQITAFPIRVG